MVTVALFDNLMFDRSPDGRTAVSCDTPGLACDESNLVSKAVNAFLKNLRDSRGAGRDAGKDRETHETPDLSEGVLVRLEKRIPMGAGLGGGSSDAASTLLALDRLWKTKWPVERLAELAASLGSDVPFFLHGPSAVCRGRGELVSPLSPPATRFALLFLPERAMPTAAVYRKFDEMRLGEAVSLEPEADPPWQSWTTLDAAELLPRLVNDLEPAAFAIDPGLGKLRGDLERTLGRVVRMSGSGSALFSLYDGQVEAEQDGTLARERHGVKSFACEVAPGGGLNTNDAIR